MDGRNSIVFMGKTMMSQAFQFSDYFREEPGRRFLVRDYISNHLHSLFLVVFDVF